MTGKMSGVQGDELASIRNRKICRVLQQTFNCWCALEFADNVMLPLLYAGVPRAERVAQPQRA